MKANEFRYHNLVNYEIDDTCTDRNPYFGKNIYQVEVIMDDSVKIGLGFDAILRVLLDDPKLNPIPLTDDWFRKFNAELFPWGWVINGILIRTDHKNKFWVELGNGKRIELPFVHTFQNLIALTGEELTIVE